VVAYTATLRPMVERLHQCALDHPEISLITQESSITGLQSNGADLTLWFGEPSQGISGQSFILSIDEIVMVAGKQVPLREMNIERLLDLYANSDPPNQLWTYPEENELRIIFDNDVIGDELITPDALLAPNPAAMIEAVTSDPTAIGYLPKSWLVDDIQAKSLNSDSQMDFAYPILALSQTEPQGNLRSYLVCLQSTAP